MNTALAERDDVTIDGEIVEPAAPLTLFGTTDPAAVVERASTVATSLAAVIDERRLYATIGQKKHVQVEGWTLLGSMLGVFAEVEWSRQLDNGWEARAVARTLAGNVVGAAEAMCTASEGRWRSADSYAIRSMAQTRAVSKALRLPLGFIMQLAGYSATPAEELSDVEQHIGRAAVRSAAPTHDDRGPDGRTAEERALIGELLSIPNMTRARMELLRKDVGVKGEVATADELREMLALASIELPEPAAVPTPVAPEGDGEGSSDHSVAHSDAASEVTDSAAATPTAGASPPGPAPSAAPSMEDVLAVTGGTDVTPPPKPGTKAYRELPDGMARSRAKEYWDKAKASEPRQETLSQALGNPVEGSES